MEKKLPSTGRQQTEFPTLSGRHATTHSLELTTRATKAQLTLSQHICGNDGPTGRTKHFHGLPLNANFRNWPGPGVILCESE